MILAAGRGQRLRPLTDVTPKPMIKIGGKPLIEHQLQWLAAAGITEVVINLHHLAEQIQSALGSGHQFGVHIRYSHEETLLDTGGGILNALPLLGDDSFLLLNGDVWTDYDFQRLCAPLPQTSTATLGHLVLTPTPPHRDGDFDLCGKRVIRAAQRPLVYCGIARLTPQLFRTETAARQSDEDGRVQPFSLAELYFEAARAGTLSGEIWSGAWTDIGSPEQLAAVMRSSPG